MDYFEFTDELRKAFDLPGSIYLHGRFYRGIDPPEPLNGLFPPHLARANAARRRAFAAGRHCAARALAEAGIHAAWLGMDNDRLPCWPEGWHGSISHSGEGAWAAATTYASHTAIGIDMERLIDEESVTEIQALIAEPNEMELLSGLPRTHAATLLFSAKEALYKALYPHVRKTFDFFAARLVSLEPEALTLRLRRHWGSGWSEGTDFVIRYAFRHGCVFTVVWLVDRGRRTATPSHSGKLRVLSGRKTTIPSIAIA